MIRAKFRAVAFIGTLAMTALAAWILLQLTRVVELIDYVVPVDLKTPWARFATWWLGEVNDALNVPEIIPEMPDSAE